MPYVEAACAVLLAAGVALRARAPGFGEWLKDAPVVFVAAWLGEDTAIRAYDFYRYNPAWHGFIDVTPVIIPAIWVFVVLSARDLARQLAPKQLIAAGYALILLDATFIEPICTYAGLWRWNEPGPFAVPYIGLLGWTFFGGSLLLCLDKLKGPQRWLSILLAPAAMHVLLTATWWSSLKWLGGRAASDVGFTFAVFVALAALTAWVISTKRHASVELALILPRLGPAAFFFALLTAYEAPLLLWLFAGAFVGPWVAVTKWRSPGALVTARSPST